jgi:2-isopropylmalate synthase
MPNVYADQIEWFGQHIAHREHIIISVHTHNDRGCAIAAAEMALLAGAQRVEGTLLGNGERTGNMDIITMAMNLYSQGIDPQLKLQNIHTIARQVSDLIQIAIHPRHPYIGDLVFTAFSGSHQDAINKCMKNYSPGDIWEVAYLPIDPTDLGRSYEEVIRINSQSGKGGVAYIIEQALGTQLPRWLQIEFSKKVQAQTEHIGAEITAQEIVSLFKDNYLCGNGLFDVTHYKAEQVKPEQDVAEFVIRHSDKNVTLQASGVGILDCFVSALSDHFALAINIVEFNEQTLQPNSSAQAIAFVRLTIEAYDYTGVAEHKDIVMASLNAILQGLSEYFSRC